MHVSRRVVLGGLLGSVAGHALANAPATSLRPVPRGTPPAKPAAPAAPSAEGLIQAANLTGQTSYVVADARTGKILESRSAKASLPPASVTKAITALYALDRLGAGYRFRTQLIATGTLTNGRLKGDLILVGGGDPTLNTDGLGDMARQLKAAGLREINGKFLVYGGVIPQFEAIDPDQPVHVSYNPAVSGLNLNFNRVHFEWKRQSGSYALQMDARASRYRPQVRIAKMRVVNRDLPIYTYADQAGADHWTVARSALGSGGSRWLPVRKPELYAAEVFQTLAKAQGITLPKAKLAARAPRGTVLVDHRSAELREILRDMLKFSTNLTAEVVGLTATASRGGVKSLKVSAKKMTTWARSSLGMSKAKFVDHSGLGGASRVTADDLVKALSKTRRTTEIAGILKDISMRNSKGEVLRNHPVKIKAKTGTLNFTSTLAGYMTARDGRELVFAILSADVPRRATIKASDGDIPPGSSGWRKRARRLQLQLIDRWGAAYVA